MIESHRSNEPAPGPIRQRRRVTGRGSRHSLNRRRIDIPTEPGNLIGLCSACHKNTHDGLLKIERQSDGRLLFFDRFGNRLDRQVDLHIAEWLDYEIGWTGGEMDSYKARCGIDWSAVCA